MKHKVLRFHFKKPHSGFTLIELLVVVGITAVLLSLGTVVYSQTQAQARDTKRKTDLKDIQTALELYKLQYSKYPDPTENDSSGWDCGGKGESFLTMLAPYMKSVPTDPKWKNSDGYCTYRYYRYSSATGLWGCDTTFYALGAKMEIPSNALNDTIPSCYSAGVSGNNWWYNTSENFFGAGERE